MWNDVNNLRPEGLIYSKWIRKYNFFSEVNIFFFDALIILNYGSPHVLNDKISESIFLYTT